MAQTPYALFHIIYVKEALNRKKSCHIQPCFLPDRWPVLERRNRSTDYVFA